MKILFFCHWSSFRQGSKLRSWLDELATELSICGNSVDFFHPIQNKLIDYDLIHIFSFQDFETWVSIARTDVAVVVTPITGGFGSEEGDAPSYSRFFAAVDWGKRILKGWMQRRWPPYDEWNWIHAADLFLPLNSNWISYLEKRWFIPGCRIQVLPSGAAAAAREMQTIYRNVTGIHGKD